MDKIKPCWKEERLLLLIDYSQSKMWVVHQPDGLKETFNAYLIADGNPLCSEVICDVCGSSHYTARSLWHRLMHYTEDVQGVSPFIYGICRKDIDIIYSLHHAYDEVGGYETYSDDTDAVRYAAGVMDDDEYE